MGCITSKPHRVEPHIARLPDDTLLIIFAFAAEACEPEVSLRISHVCSQWGRLAVSSPRLWCVTVMPKIDMKPAFLDVCLQRCNGIVTDACFMDCDTSVEELKRCFALLQQSRATLVMSLLDVGFLWNEDALNILADEAQSQQAAKATPDDDQALQQARSRILQLALASPKLDFIFIVVNTEALEHIDPAQLSLVPLAKPRKLVIAHMESELEPPSDTDVAAAFRPWLHLLDKLTPAVEELHFTQYPSSVSTEGADRRDCMQWAWATMHRRTPYLRSLRIRADPECLSQPREVTMPRLFSLDLYDGPYEYTLNHRPDPAATKSSYEAEYSGWLGEPHSSWDAALRRSAWLMAPFLKEIAASPTIAIRVAASKVECAHLRIWDPKELPLLAQVLASWPNLLSLTLDIMPERFRILGQHPLHAQSEEEPACNWARRALEDVLAVLSPGVCGAVHAPKLRHLGLVWCNHTHDSPIKGLRWAGTPWSDQDGRLACRIADEESCGIPVLSERILDVVRHRQQLSKGRAGLVTVPEEAPGRRGSDTSLCSPHPAVGPASVSGSCDALQSIKIGGMLIRPWLWKRLQKEPQLQFTCGSPKS